MTTPVLTTARLILRAPQEDDLDRWAALMADPDASRFIGGPLPRSSAWRGMAAVRGCWSLRGFGMFSVIERSSGTWVGRAGPWMPEGWPGPEIVWALHRDAWGKGFATEAAEAAIDWAVDTLGWTRFIHIIAPANLPSQAVARRLDSRREGPVRMPHPYGELEVECWAQSAQNWRARRRRP